jgi:hypothetical protein
MLPFTGHQEPESRRGIVMTNVFERKSRTEVEAFFEEAYPFPVRAIALLSLLVGNVAVTLAAISALARTAASKTGKKNPVCPDGSRRGSRIGRFEPPGGGSSLNPTRVGECAVKGNRSPRRTDVHRRGP